MPNENPTHTAGGRGERGKSPIHAARAQIAAARLRREALIASGNLPDSSADKSASLPTKDFPGYTLIREIHRGGQGVVYQALQQSTNRKVAIKVLLEGAHASKSARQRFDREIELVASLRHPNVISVFHSHQTADGLRFCVMDYVRGLPLTRYVRENNLSLPDALRLFATVCEAVNHAHQKGVIHRDLKPSNILVDVEGVPRVLDFGLAKLVGGPEQSLVSMTGQIVGTLPYMSPEQTRGNPDEIDTRTDVYALGVLLYELLTGRYPYPVSGPVSDVLRHIAQTDPTSPSRAWTAESGITSTKHSSRARPVVARSGSRPGRLHLRRSVASPIDDEVQTIVLKALAKERERRYQSAGELARDIEHYLAGEPIEAKRDSKFYVLSKQLRRYKASVAVVVAFVVLLSAATVSLLVLYRRATQQAAIARIERDRAEVERNAATGARNEALAARNEAETRQKESRQQAYIAIIAAAEASLRAGEIGTVRRRLEAAPPDLRNWEWRHLWARSDQSLATLRGHDDCVNAVAFNPDGRHLASAADDTTIRLWDTASGAELTTLRGHTQEIYSVAFSPDGTRIASGSVDKMVRIWDTVHGMDLATLRHDDIVEAIAFSPNGMRVASASWDKTVRIWDTASGIKLATLRGHNGYVCSVAFSPDGTRLASGAQDTTIKLWDTATGLELTTLHGHKNGVRCVSFSPDGMKLASGSDDTTAKLWETVAGTELASLRGHETEVSSVAFSPDGSRLATASGTVRIWDLEKGAALVTLHGHEAKVASVVFSPDGRRIASASVDGTVKLWDAMGGVDPTLLKEHSELIWSIAFSPDGRRLASGSGDATIRLWDGSSGAELAVLHGHEERVRCVCFNPDGTRLVSGSEDGTIKLWDVATGVELTTLRGLGGSSWSVAFSPDGARLASGSGGGTIGIWDARRGTEIVTLRGHSIIVAQVVFSPDGTRLASGADDGTVQLWDVASGAAIATLRGHNTPVYSVAFSPDGKHLASSSADATVKLWDVASGAESETFRGHTSFVWSVAFSPDGTRLASCSSDRTVRLWDVASGAEVATLRGHDHGVISLAFSPDGKRLASGGRDGTLILWDTLPRPVREAMPARSLVDGLFDRLGTPSRVVEHLRQDPSLSPAMRSAAEIAVLIRTTELTAEVNSLLARLFDELKLAADVMARLRNDVSLNQQVREFALELVQRRGDDPARLNEVSRPVLIDPNQSELAYREALRWMETACEIEPNSVQLLDTLGMAQYRVGAYTDALATMTRWEALYSASTDPNVSSGFSTTAIAFLAMSLHKLGRINEARTALVPLRGLMEEPRNAHDAISRDLLREAEALIDADTAGDESAIPKDMVKPE